MTLAASAAFFFFLSVFLYTCWELSSCILFSRFFLLFLSKKRKGRIKVKTDQRQKKGKKKEKMSWKNKITKISQTKKTVILKLRKKQI